MSDTKALLQQSAPFNEFGDATLDRFISEANEQEFAAGDVIFQELSEDSEIYFIVNGEIRISVELASAYHVNEEIRGGPGELVGEGQFIAHGPRAATVTATTDVTTLVWDVDSWKAIAEENPAVGYRLAVYAGQVLFARIQRLKDHLIDDISWGIE